MKIEELYYRATKTDDGGNCGLCKHSSLLCSDDPCDTCNSLYTESGNYRDNFEPKDGAIYGCRNIKRK